MKRFQAKLKEDLDSINKQLQDLFKDHSLSKNEKFLNKFSKNITNLHEDYILVKKDPKLTESMDLLHYLLTTPWGAPFVADTTLLEAAITYKYQEPTKSDLYQLLKGFLKYSTYEDNEFISVFHELIKNIS